MSLEPKMPSSLIMKIGLRRRQKGKNTRGGERKKKESDRERKREREWRGKREEGGIGNYLY